MDGSVKTVVLADDHPLVLGALRQLVQSVSGLRVLTACGDGQTALEELRRLHPDLAVVDVSMPGLTGLELLSCAQREGLGARVALITAAMSDADLVAASDGGAAAIMFKDWAPEDIAACVRRVLDGAYCLPSPLIDAARAREAERRSRSPELGMCLTAREHQVVADVAAGLSNKEIARDLALTEGTVKVHLHHIYEKTGVRNRVELARLAVKARP
jgi:two-component system, NarL family, nitrate/nitrite response regulator NarL